MIWVHEIIGSNPITSVTLLLKRNFKEKEGIFILLITKKTAQILNKEYKVPFGYEGISVSGTRRKYYLTENEYNLNALKELENKNK